jgi:hypothetical protein
LGLPTDILSFFSPGGFVLVVSRAAIMLRSTLPDRGGLFQAPRASALGVLWRDDRYAAFQDTTLFLRRLGLALGAPSWRLTGSSSPLPAHSRTHYHLISLFYIYPDFAVRGFLGRGTTLRRGCIKNFEFSFWGTGEEETSK